MLTKVINKTEYYNETAIESFIFSYGFKNEAIPNKKDMPDNVNIQKFENNNLPISINPSDFGVLTDTNKLGDSIKYTLQAKHGKMFIINKFDSHNEVELFEEGKSIVKFADTNLFDNKFIRTIDNKKIYFENNELILYTKEMKTKFISKLKNSKVLTENFLTLDIETYVKDSILTVFCLGIYDGIKTNTFYLSDYENPEQLILAAIKSIMIRKHNK
jgi:hypothetical protein